MALGGAVRSRFPRQESAKRVCPRRPWPDEKRISPCGGAWYASLAKGVTLSAPFTPRMAYAWGCWGFEGMPEAHL